MKLIPIDEILEIVENGHEGHIRRVDPKSGEEPDFVQKTNKLCTGMFGRLPDGKAYSFDLNPPVQLVAGRGYKIVLEHVH